ncbi:MAG: hypothetical protein PHR06_00575 [Candidatus Cloacimonetes bacterium]|nr:hypothetical protein [Candidatus Cloacimonadota bacterium]
MINSELLEYELLKGYEAGYSLNKRKIECQLSGLNEIEYENLCHYISNFDPSYSDEGELNNSPPLMNTIDNSFGVTLSIGYCSKAFIKLLEYKHSILSLKSDIFTLIISDADISSHQEAFENLSKFGLSVLFSISCKLHIDLDLLTDQPRTINNWSELYDIEFAMQCSARLPKIDHTYDIEPLKYYLKANMSSNLPFYQYLQYYHCFEYYFPEYRILRKLSHSNSGKKTKLLDIRDKFLSIFSKRKTNGGELEDLKFVFNRCLIKSDVLNYIKTNRLLHNYYFKKLFKKISSKEIIMSDSISLDKIAIRFYDIRNSIVHSKSKEKRIESNEENYGLIRNDIRLIKYMVEQLLITKKVEIT